MICKNILFKHNIISYEKKKIFTHLTNNVISVDAKIFAIVDMPYSQIYLSPIIYSTTESVNTGAVTDIKWEVLN